MTYIFIFEYMRQRTGYIYCNFLELKCFSNEKPKLGEYNDVLQRCWSVLSLNAIACRAECLV